MADCPEGTKRRATMTDTEQPRETKRVRQACSNCRRKKVRCSGDRPSCSFCERLQQSCDYLRGDTWVDGDFNAQTHGCTSGVSDDLLARVLSLETKLTRLEHWTACMPPAGDVPHQLYEPKGSRSDTWDEVWRDKSQNSHSVRSVSPVSLARLNGFYSLPPISVVQNACDAFFEHFHNQPYAFFHEGSFRQRLQDRSLPDYLIFAFLSLAIRYSTDPLFEGNQDLAQETYASKSWDLIVSSGFSTEECSDTAVVQAISLLAVVDSAAGRRRAAWVKIGLSIRLCQDLHLTMEPDTTLPAVEREQRRRLFWSIYLLDRFVSCSKQRPHILLNSDCHLQLPCDEVDFRNGVESKTATLINLSNGASNSRSTYRPSHFALLVLMAWVLGRCARYTLDDRHATGEHGPFHPQSDYVAISSVLLYYESFVDSGGGVDEVIRSGMLKPDGSVDQQMVGHMVMTRVLFHLCNSLLNHPFLLRQRVVGNQSKAPTTWLARSLDTGLEHAGKLIKVYRDARHAGCTLSSSFYGYSLLIAGTIHGLHSQSSNANSQRGATAFLVAEIGYLDDIAKFWRNSSLIATGLKTFWSYCARFNDLVDPLSLACAYSASERAILWTSVDYGLMSDPERSLSQHSLSEIPSLPEWGLSPWKDAGEPSETIITTEHEFFLSGSEDAGDAIMEAGYRAPAQSWTVNGTQFHFLPESILEQPQTGTDLPGMTQRFFDTNSDGPYQDGLTRTQSTQKLLSPEKSER